MLGSVYHDAAGGVLKQSITLAYPIGDVVIGVVVVAAMVRAKGRYRVTLALLGGGLLALAVADSSFAYLTEINAYSTTNHLANLNDSGWVIGYLALGWPWCGR